MSHDENVNSRKIHDGLSAYDKFHPWINLVVWNLVTEATPLILGCAPEFYDSFKDDLKDEASNIINTAKSCALSSLPFFDEYGKYGSHQTCPEDSVNEWRIDSRKFLIWAIDNDIGINKEFLDTYNHVNVPVYVNRKDSSSFILQIDESQFTTRPNLERLNLFNIAALDAYDYFWKKYSKSERKSNPRSKKIIEYLKDNYGDTLLNKDDFERIQVLIRHPDTYKGGQ